MTSFVGIVSIITFCLAAVTALKTRRVGATLGVIIVGAVILLARNTAFIQALSDAMGTVLTNVVNAIPGMLG